MSFTTRNSYVSAGLLLALLSLSGHSFAAEGIDTASGTTDLPFNIEGNNVMKMTATGLTVGSSAIDLSKTGNITASSNVSAKSVSATNNVTIGGQSATSSTVSAANQLAAIMPTCNGTLSISGGQLTCGEAPTPPPTPTPTPTPPPTTCDSDSALVDGVCKVKITSGPTVLVCSGTSLENTIISYYKTDFGRCADSGGLAYWVNQVTSGAVKAADLNAAIISGGFSTNAQYKAYGLNAPELKALCPSGYHYVQFTSAQCNLDGY